MPAATTVREFKFCPVCAAGLIERREGGEGGKNRLACPHGHWTHWDNPLPVLAALVEIDGRILLVRTANQQQRKFGLVAGFMERDETPEQGIARELKEETGLDAGQTELIGVYEFMRKNELLIVYHVRASGTIVLSDELIEYCMVAPDALRAWPSGTGHAVADWLRTRGLPVHFCPQ